MDDRRSDAELLAGTARDPACFGVFYERHEEAVLMFHLRRTGQPDLAADLTAETFAQALTAASRFQPGPSPAGAWLLGIARNVLAMSRRRGRVEDAARRRLAMEPVVLDDLTLERVAAIDAFADIRELLGTLAPDQRQAVLERVVSEREYADIALELECSESVVRQRVSRGLARLRSDLGGAR